MPTVLSPVPQGEWHAVLAGDADALPEHIPEWVGAMVDTGRYRDVSRLYDFGGGRRFVLPLVRRTGPSGFGGWYASFPPGWGIGGLVGDGVDAEVVAAVVDDLRGLDAARVVVRPDPVRATSWSAANHGATVVARRAHAIDLSGGMESVHAGLSKSTRRGIRRAEQSGVKIQRGGGDLLPVYQRLRRQAVTQWARRQHEPLPLSRWRDAHSEPAAKPRGLAARLGGDSFRCYVAMLDDVPVAASIVLFGNTAHDTRGVMDRALAGPVHANDLLQWTTITDACEAGCATYHLGESGQSSSLARFKERFGARPFDYPELHIERLPFTRIDAGMRAGIKRVIGFRDAS